MFFHEGKYSASLGSRCPFTPAHRHQLRTIPEQTHPVFASALDYVDVRAFTIFDDIDADRKPAYHEDCRQCGAPIIT